MLVVVVVARSRALAEVMLFIQPLVQIVYLHMWWYNPLQRALVVLFRPATSTKLHLHSGNLCCVVYIHIYPVAMVMGI